MEMWLDAHVPPSLAVWIEGRFGIRCRSFEELGFLTMPDSQVFKQAGPGVVVVSKDSDFPELVARLHPPPQVLWLTCGNCRNPVLRSTLERSLPAALELLQRGEPMVEIP